MSRSNHGERPDTVQAAPKLKTANYRDLLVWQKRMELVKTVYTLTKPFPPEERFGLVAQMRRAAVTVPSNIVEGQACKSTAEFIRFRSNAEGSVAELGTQLTLCAELGFCTAANAEAASGLIPN